METTAISSSSALRSNNHILQKLSLISWGIFYIAVLIHSYLAFPLDSQNFQILAGLSGFGLLILILQYKLKDKALPSNVLTSLYTLSGVVVVIMTGGVESPFWFLVYLIPLIAHLKGSSTAPFALAGIEVVLLGGYEIYQYLILNQPLPDPIKLILFTLSPLAIGYCIEVLLKNFEIQKQTNDKVIESIRTLEQQVKQKVLSFEEIVQGIPSGVITTNNDYQVTLANRRALEILKKSWSTINNRHIYDVWPTQIVKGQRIMQGEVSLSDLDGKNIIVNIKEYPLISDGGKHIGKIYMITDITHEKELEQMEFDFVTMAAHQLRTPLTSLRGYLSVVIGAALQKLNDDEKLYLRRSMFSTDQLLSLVENLINIARIEKGGLKIEFVPFHMELVIENALEMVAESARQKNVKLLYEPPKQALPQCLGNQYLVGEVVKNLINNAIEFNKPGGWVMVTSQIQPQYMVIHISDNGKGIPSSSMEKLFTKFYRVSNKLNQDSKGTGLGLFISKSIIEAHKGQIWVNSIEEKGSTFSFMIPLVPQHHSQISQTSQPPIQSIAVTPFGQ